MIVQSYVFDFPSESTTHNGPSNQGLKMTGKKYSTSFSENELHGLTLLFAHGVGSRELHLGPTKSLMIDVAHAYFSR